MGIFLNIDSTHYFYTRDCGKDYEKQVREFADIYKGTQVERILYGVNCMRASFNSRCFDRLWDGFDPSQGAEQELFGALTGKSREMYHTMVKNAYAFSVEHNVYRDLIERTRKNGISAWVSVRMDDLHCVDKESHPFHNTFWKENPQFRCSPYKFSAYQDKALDYRYPEVRALYKGLIADVLDQYDVDGLELDWMRFGYVFTPGFEEEGRRILTEYVREIRELTDQAAKKYHHTVELSVRVPSRPQTAFEMGYDVLEWAEQGLVDEIVYTPFWASVENDMPVELWNRILKHTKVRAIPGLELLLRPDPEETGFQTNSLETARGSAYQYLSRGAEHIYLYNYFDCLTAMKDLQNYPTLLRELGELTTMCGKERRHVVTFSDIHTPGTAFGTLLPAAIKSEGESRMFRINCGQSEKREAFVFLGLKEYSKEDVETIRIFVNGQRCEREEREITKYPFPEGDVYCYRVSKEALRSGENMVDVIGVPSVICWVELYFAEQSKEH